MITLSHFDATLFGDHIVTHVNTYTTKDRKKCAYEIHKHFVDVQYLLSGQEYIDIVAPKGLTLRAPFDEEKDIAFFNELVAPDCRVLLRPNLYCVIFPWEAHMPCIAVDTYPKTSANTTNAPLSGPMEVKKAVTKIPLEDFMRVFHANILFPPFT